MKLLPKQPVCPYCQTVYRRGDAKQLVRKKTEKCYHCGKIFRVSKISFWFLLLEMLAVYAALNAIMIGLAQIVMLLPLFLINLIPPIAAFLLLPFYTEGKKTDKKLKKKVK